MAAADLLSICPSVLPRRNFEEEFMKTGRKVFTLLAVILLIVIAAGVILGLSGDSMETFSADLYFINEAKTSIYSEKRDVEYEHKRDLPELVMNELAKGPASSGVDVIPEKASWYISKTSSRIMVDFSKDFLTTDSKQDMLATYAVVKSLCSVDGIGAVKVTVEGEELTGPDNTPIGYLTRNDIDIEEEENLSVEKNLKLYFYSDVGILSEEWRTVKITDTAPIAEYLIAELIKGPQKEGLSRVISPETKLISVEVTEGVAYVNMTASFAEKNKGDSKKEWTAVYSVVNTLLDLPEINGVQFLIEGKKEKGMETIDLSILFARE